MLLSHCSPTELLLRVLSVKEVPLFRKSYYFCAPGNPQFRSSLPHSIPLAVRTMLMFPTSVNAQHLRWRLFDSFFFMAFLSPLSLHKRLSPCCFRRWYWLKVSGRKSKHGNGVKMRHSKWNFRITCVVVVYLTFAAVSISPALSSSKWDAAGLQLVDLAVPRSFLLWVLCNFKEMMISQILLKVLPSP